MCEKLIAVIYADRVKKLVAVIEIDYCYVCERFEYFGRIDCDYSFALKNANFDESHHFYCC